MDPVERQDLVGQSAVGVKIFTAGIGREIIKAQHICPVIEGEEDNAVPHKCVAVIQLVGGIAGIVTAAENIDEDGEIFSLQRALNIDCEAVLVADDNPVVVLDRGGAVFFGIVYVCPGRVRNGSLEAERPHGRFRVRNAQIFDHAVSLISLYLAECCGCDVLIHNYPPYLRNCHVHFFMDSETL